LGYCETSDFLRIESALGQASSPEKRGFAYRERWDPLSYVANVSGSSVLRQNTRYRRGNCPAGRRHAMIRLAIEIRILQLKINRRKEILH
jgi:hypothetical protein